MHQLLKDVQSELMSDPRLADVNRAGGVSIVDSAENITLQNSPPAIIIMDGGARGIEQLSSYVVRITFHLDIFIVQQVYDKAELQIGGLTARSISEISNDVRRILTNNRLKARYAQFNWTGESEPKKLPSTENIFLQEKTLTFEVVRIESP